MQKNTLIDNTNAEDWVTEFMIRNKGKQVTKEDMIGWFASAIETGRNVGFHEAMRKQQKANGSSVKSTHQGLRGNGLEVAIFDEVREIPSERFKLPTPRERMEELQAKEEDYAEVGKLAEEVADFRREWGNNKNPAKVTSTSGWTEYSPSEKIAKSMDVKITLPSLAQGNKVFTFKKSDK